MSARHAVARILTGPDEWTRRRLQIAMATAGVVTIMVVAGIGWSIVALLHGGTATASADQTSHAISYGAATLGPEGSLSKALPGPLAPKQARTIRLPQPSTLGDAQVGTGLPHSAAGAMAQLVAIDQRAIGSASVVTAEDVIASWASPGGPTFRTWSGVAAVEALLRAAGVPTIGSSDLTVQLDPEMGLVRDSSRDAATVCVDFVVSATIDDSKSSHIAVADCQHMSWAADRWLIGSGPEASPTASLWPGTSASYAAGYLWLEVLP
jgi:hypothetical protein